MKNNDYSYRPLPHFLTISKSKIEGIGVFAKENIDKGTDLGMSHVFDSRFPDGYIRLSLGGFINHHEIPNCKAEIYNNDSEIGLVRHIRLITAKKIKKGDELTVRYIINILDNPNWEFEYEVSQ
ncbi:MAG: SET domain-containing protein [Candidatus Marivariicella framensis]